MRMNLDRHAKPLKLAGLLLIILLVTYLVVHRSGKHTEPDLPLPMVTVKKPVLANMVDYVTQTGTTVHFRETEHFKAWQAAHQPNA